MGVQIEEGFLDYFCGLEDPRSRRNQRYSVSEILLVTLSAAICGAEGWQDVEDFGHAKRDFLRSILPFRNGIPSDDTFRRFFRAIDTEKFQDLFRAWIEGIRPSLTEGVIAIDGKSSRHSFDGDKKMLHMISAYASEAGLVLAQEKVADKSNEITAIPKLLDWLDVRSSVVTIDAMGCQTQIAEKIQHKGGDYVFALKRNQDGLFEDISLYFEDEDHRQSCATLIHHDKGHGRLEERRIWVCQDVGWLTQRHPQWRSIRGFLCIESRRTIKGKTTTETRYYITSLKASPQKCLAAVRSHWAIENGLHWVLDVSFGEDQSRIRKHNAPHAMAIIRHIAFNLLKAQKNAMKRQSIKRLRKMGGWSNDTLTQILSQKSS